MRACSSARSSSSSPDGAASGVRRVPRTPPRCASSAALHTARQCWLLTRTPTPAPELHAAVELTQRRVKAIRSAGGLRVAGLRLVLLHLCCSNPFARLRRRSGSRFGVRVICVAGVVDLGLWSVRRRPRAHINRCRLLHRGLRAQATHGSAAGADTSAAASSARRFARRLNGAAEASARRLTRQESEGVCCSFESSACCNRCASEDPRVQQPARSGA